MSDHKVNGVDATSSAAQRMRLQQTRVQEAALATTVRIDAAESGFDEWTDNAVFNPLAANKRFEQIQQRVRTPERERSQGSKKDDDIETNFVEEIIEIAEQFGKKNPELQARFLVGLHQLINDDDSPDEIMEKLLTSYPDPYLATEALEFLLASSKHRKGLQNKLLQTKELLYNTYEKQIKIGQNISQEAREFSRKGLGTASGLRDFYKEVIATEQEPIQFFEDLIKKFPYEQMKSVLAFLLHSLGADLKSKGSTIDPIELQKLVSEIRNAQAILGVYLFFRARIYMLQKQFSKEGLFFPKELSFEQLAKYYVMLLSERYPNVNRVLQLAAHLGLSESLIAQMLIFTQYKEALRYTSPRLFKSDRHRQDLLEVLIDCITELDEEIEEEEEEEDKDDEETEEEP